MERLQKALAHAGVASRRACEQLIAEGRVTVNGQVVTTLGTQVTPGVDKLAVDGRVVGAHAPQMYILLNKPVGYVSTTQDPQGRPTVLDLVNHPGAPRLYPVGRLDIDTEGLLILTNDGAFAQRLTHPRYEVEKEYLAWVEGTPAEEDLARLRSGIPIDGRPAPVDNVTVVERMQTREPTTVLRLVIHEGRKREVRRLIDALGYRVLRLQRVRQGSLHLGDLPVGAWRHLSPREVAQLASRAPSATTLAASVPPLTASHQTPSRRPHAAPETSRDNDYHRRPRRRGQERAGRASRRQTGLPVL